MQNNAMTTLSTALQSVPEWGLKPISMAEWMAVWSPFTEMLALHPLQEDGTNFWQSAVQDPIAGARYSTGSQLIRHRLRQAGPNRAVLAIQYIRSGTVAMEFESRRFVQRPGSVAIMDLARPFKGSHQNAVGEIIFVPRAILGFSETDYVDPILLTVESLQGKLLAAEIGLFFDLCNSADPVDFQPSTLLHIAASVISQNRHASSDRVVWWRARNKLIRDFIEDNLGDLNLLPAQICNTFYLSRATLYRMFEADGGVRRYIQDRRLYSAVWDLAEGGIHRGRLTEVAEKWGFSSNANFNRAVKTAFNMPPGALFRPPSFVVPARLGERQDEFPLFAWFTRDDRKDSSIF